MGGFICRNIEDYTGVFDKPVKKLKKTMYQVFDNGKPADCKHHKVHKSWDNSKFDTWQAAMAYARKWLGTFAVPLKLNTPVDYSGYGDMIEVRKVK